MMNSVFSMRIEHRPLLGKLWILAVAGLLVAATTIRAEVTVLTGATVHPMTGPALEGASVVIENGRIQAVGMDLEVPESATSIDLEGLHLYPGFLHPATTLGLTEISSVAGTVDVAEIGNINAALRTEVAFNHDSELLPTTIAGGVLSAHVVPGGGLIRGSSAVMNLDGWSWEEMGIGGVAGMHVAYPEGAVEDDDNEELKLLERVLSQARHWHQAHRAAENGGRRPVHNDQLEALGPLLDGSIPLFLHASRAETMEAALDWASDQGFSRVILVGGSDVQYLADRLAADEIPVILRSVLAMPTRRWEAYDMAFVAPGILHEAGVKFAIADSGGGLDVANSRNLPFHAGMATAHGLDPEAALKSVTLWPAEILGVDDELGSIEPGRRATFFAATGDPLEPMTRIEQVWIDGQAFDLGQDRTRRMYERYRSRNQAVQDVGSASSGME